MKKIILWLTGIVSAVLVIPILVVMFNMFCVLYAINYAHSCSESEYKTNYESFYEKHKDVFPPVDELRHFYSHASYDSTSKTQEELRDDFRIGVKRYINESYDLYMQTHENEPTEEELANYMIKL